MLMSQITICKGLFRLRGEGGDEKGSKVELTENRLILGQFYSIPRQSKRTIGNRYIFEETGKLLKERENNNLYKENNLKRLSTTNCFPNWSN